MHNVGLLILNNSEIQSDSYFETTLLFPIAIIQHIIYTPLSKYCHN